MYEVGREEGQPDMLQHFVEVLGNTLLSLGNGKKKPHINQPIKIDIIQQLSCN
jgi:hypothetical protein